MKKEIKIVGLSIAIEALTILTLYLCGNKLINYGIIFMTIDFVAIFYLIMYTYSSRDEDAIFESNLKRILKTYDAVLVSSNNIVNLEGKNIVVTDNIDDVIDAQIEIRKPVYYYKQTESCSFVLLDNETALVCTLKKNDEIVSPLEITLKELKIKQSMKEKNIEHSILEEIEKTTIVKLGRGKAYRVSPIK